MGEITELVTAVFVNFILFICLIVSFRLICVNKMLLLVFPLLSKLFTFITLSSNFNVCVMMWILGSN